MRHRYSVGQMLEVRPSPRHSTRVGGPCEVIACLPHDRGPLLYRIKSLREGVERVVEENDLSPSSALRPERPTIESPFSISISKR